MLQQRRQAGKSHFSTFRAVEFMSASASAFSELADSLPLHVYSDWIPIHDCCLSQVVCHVLISTTTPSSQRLQVTSLKIVSNEKIKSSPSMLPLFAAALFGPMQATLQIQSILSFPHRGYPLQVRPEKQPDTCHCDAALRFRPGPWPGLSLNRPRTYSPFSLA